MIGKPVLCCKCKIIYFLVFVIFLIGVYFLLDKVATPIPRTGTVTTVKQSSTTNKQAETATPEYYATYDLFNKHFTLLFTVFGILVSFFGVIIPLAFNFYQQTQFKIETDKIRNDFKNMQETLKQNFSESNKIENDKLKSEIEKQRETLDLVKEKLQADFKSKTDELIKNEKEIELKLQFRTVVLLKNHIVSNIYVYDKNNENDSYIVISYLLFYQLMTAALILLENEYFQSNAASIITTCFNVINNVKPLIEIYDNTKRKWSYKKIYDRILGEYRELFNPELIEFLEEVKKRETERASGSGGNKPDRPE